MSASGQWMRLFRESFVPVIIGILGIFLLLLYVQFRAEYDAEATTVINIPAVAPLAADDDTAPAQGDANLAVSEGGGDSEHQRARMLMREEKWNEAERIYKRILARRPDSNALNDLGVLYLKKGDAARALTYLNQAVRTNPANTHALFNRARALARGGRTKEALDAYRTLLAKQPDHFEAQYNLGLLLIEQGDNAAGADAMAKAAHMASGKRKAKALYSLALAQRDMGQRAAAGSTLEQAIRLQPSAPELRVAVATLEPDTPEGQVRALAQYDKVLELSPNYPPALVNMASILNAQNKRRDAERALRQAIQFDPENIQAHRVLGQMLLADKHWQESRSEFEWVLRHDPAVADAHFNLGRIAYGEKDYDKAIREYRAAVKTAAGKYPEAHLNLGLVYVAKDDYAAALAAYEAAVKQRPQYPEAWYNMGMAFLRQDRNERAERAFKEALRQRPDYEQAWFNLGVIYGNTARDDQAIDAYRKALRIRPDYHQAQLNLAVRYARQKKYDEAVRLYRELLAHDDSYALAWLNLGNAYIETKQPADAVAALRKASALDPSNTKALLLLGRALLLNNNDRDAVEVLQSAVAADTADAALRLEFARALRQVGRDDDARAELAKARQLDPKLHGVNAELQKF